MNDVSDKKTLWISIYHPAEIISAMGLALLLRDKYVINLFIKNHPYWKGMGDDFYKNYFDNIYHFPNIGFSKHFLREVKKIIQIKRILKGLLINKNDTLITFSNKSFVDNIFLSIYKNVKSIKIVSWIETVASLRDFINEHKNYRENITSKIWNLFILPWFGLEPVVFLKNTDDKGLYEIIYKKGDRKIFGELIFFRNYDSENLQSDEVYNFLPYIKQKLNVQNQCGLRKQIVFFGEGSNLTNQYHFDFINKCLRYIENFFPEHDLVFKPHPVDRKNFEVKHITLGKFSLYEGKQITQLYLLENINKIEYCFGVSSTSLGISMSLGFVTYYFLKLYTDYSSEFYNLMLCAAGNINRHAFIEDFDVKPLTYQVQINNLEKFNNNINKILKYLN